MTPFFSSFRSRPYSGRFLFVAACLTATHPVQRRFQPGSAIREISRENRTIAVTATERVILPADAAAVHVGFIVYGPDSDAAYATGSRLSNAITSALTRSGISPEFIESENQNLSPVQDYQQTKLTDAERAQHKFQLTQSWIVRTSADAAARVLDLAVKAGANQSGQIDWSLRDENAAEADAAAKALQRAHATADQLARSMNVKLGILLHVANATEGTPVQPLIRPMAMAQKVVEPLSINPRRIEKSATVYAVFAIE